MKRQPKVALITADGKWSGWQPFNTDGPTEIPVEGGDGFEEYTVVSVLIERPGGMLTGELLTEPA